MRCVLFSKRNLAISIITIRSLYPCSLAPNTRALKILFICKFRGCIAFTLLAHTYAYKRLRSLITELLIHCVRPASELVRHIITKSYAGTLYYTMSNYACDNCLQQSITEHPIIAGQFYRASFTTFWPPP